VTEEHFIDRMLDTVKDSETAVEGDTLRKCDISSCIPEPQSIAFKTCSNAVQVTVKYAFKK